MRHVWLAGLLAAGWAAPALAGDETPLVVLVQGSERTGSIGTAMPYVLAAQGISAFVFDKRGAGASEGDYTQNF